MGNAVELLQEPGCRLAFGLTHLLALICSRHASACESVSNALCDCLCVDACEENNVCVLSSEFSTQSQFLHDARLRRQRWFRLANGCRSKRRG